MFILICRYGRVSAYPGDDVTLSSHLSPETSAVSMEIRWFRGTECIYMYKNGQVSVTEHYKGRASLLTQELSRGNVSLTLKSVSSLDMGIYSCQVLTGQDKVEKSIHLCISGTEPLSPELSSPVGTKLTEKNSVDMEDSVLLLELKKLLQQQEKELQYKTRELEATTELLKTKSSLLLYMGMDVENINQLANQTEEHLKNVLSELETSRSQVEQLGQKLQEKDALVNKLRDVLQEKDQQLDEAKKKHLGGNERNITGGLKNPTQDSTHTQESLQLLELKNLLQNKEKELEDKTSELEHMTGELTRMTKLLQDRDRDGDVQNLEEDRDTCMRCTSMAGEMEMCLKELETLGQKLQDKNTQVQELGVVLRAKDRELDEERKRRHVIPENTSIKVSHMALSEMYPKPKEDLQSWIAKKREKRRLQEEEERTEVLEREFLDYVSAVKELIGKKHEKILAWAKMADVLQKKLEVVETDEDWQALQAQLQEALEMQKLGEVQIEQLTESLEEKRSDIEEKHKHELEEIREKYSTVSRIEAETNILEIILPDVLSYFQNAGPSVPLTLDEREQMAGDRVETGVRKDSRGSGDVPVETEEDVVKTVTSASEINNNRVGSLVHQSREGEMLTEANDWKGGEAARNKMVNGVILEEDEDEEEDEAQ